MELLLASPVVVLPSSKIPHFLVKLVFMLRGQNKVWVGIFHKVTLPG